LLLNSRNVTRDLDQHVLRIVYEDHEEAEADTVDIDLEDKEGKFRGAWYPTKGDALSLRLGYLGSPFLDCGQFEVDEIGYRGPPDVLSIKAVAAGVKEPRRTRQAKAYESTTLKGLAEAVAQRGKLKLVGAVEAIPIRRATQVRESDLEFLRRVAGEYGYAFSVKGRQLVFFKRSALAAGKSVLTLKRLDVRPYSFRDKLMDVVQSAEVAYHDPKTKSVKRGRAGGQGAASADSLKLNLRAESSAQAQAKADAALEAANREATTFEGTTYGNLKLLAGVNILLEDFGALSGAYHTKMSRHTLDRDGGYSTEIEARRING
jgi:phage protein D